MGAHQNMSEEKRVNQTLIRLLRCDITDLEVDAFVYYAQPNLAIGSGFGTAISVRGGPTIQKELAELGPVATGEAVVSSAGNLKATHIVHAVGPRFQEEDTEAKLRTTVLNSLRRAEETGVKTIAFPPMGAGFYGVPLDLCAQVMLETIASYAKGETGIREVIICAVDGREYRPFEARLDAVG